jgi:AcrR family transcriptional regulator
MQEQAASSSLPLSRERILEATWFCLHEWGYDTTTIRKIAGQLDCSVGSIYRYFADKHELLLAVTQRVLIPVVDLLEAGGDFEPSISLYSQRSRANEEAYRLMFWLAGLPTKDQKQRKAAAADAAMGMPEAAEDSAKLPDVVETIISHWAGQLGDAQLARQGWALLHGSVMCGQSAESVVLMLGKLKREPAASSNEDVTLL